MPLRCAGRRSRGRRRTAMTPARVALVWDAQAARWSALGVRGRRAMAGSLAVIGFARECDARIWAGAVGRMASVRPP